MSIRTTSWVVFTVLVLLLGTLAVLTNRAAGDLTALAHEGERRHASYLLADELRQSSDDLTRMARTYIVTGDERYERYFREILDVRNGTAGRPEGYQGIYWDFVAAGGAPGARGPRVSLEALMRAQGFTDAEFADLREAQKRSDALVTLEDRAMNAMKGQFPDDSTGLYTVRRDADPTLARTLMHGAEYHAAKAAIMGPIQKVFVEVDARTAGQVEEVRARADRLGQIALLVAIAGAAFAVVGLLAFQRQVIGPVRAICQRMDGIAEGERDLTQRMAVPRTEELGRLARSFNGFVSKIHGSLREVAGAAEVVLRSTQQIAAATRQQEAAAATFGAAAGQIAGAGTEISDTSERLAGTMQHVMANARDSATAAAAGRHGLEGMGATMAGLLRATEGVGGRLQTIDQRAEVIVTIVATMTKVADQANLLSVNAAIEAEKAGEHGRGFLVVAREISRLAEETANATLEIEASITAMQGAVGSGVAEMGQFAGNVRKGAGAVTGVGEELGGVISRVEALSAAFARVNAGVAQQTVGAHSIREATESLRTGSQESLEAAGEVSRSAAALLRAVGTLHDTVAQFRLDG